MSVLGLLILGVLLQGAANILEPDASRDRALHVPIQEFLLGNLTDWEFEAQLREYGRQFALKPYKLSRITMDLKKVPSGHLDRYMEVMLRIIVPPLRAFLKGELTAEETAMKVAPFVIIVGSYGFGSEGSDARPDLARLDELTRKISQFAAP